MYNLLTDGLIRVRLIDGSSAALSLPAVYEAMAADRVAAFVALRPHQRHAWHAFLAQLGVIAVERSRRTTASRATDQWPQVANEWRVLLRELTQQFSDDEPWRLVVDDPARPAFMQCPAPNGLGHYNKRVATPDDLDVLITSKNHDVKQEVAVGSAPDDWALALISLQTMGAQLGRGNYGVARMNGGYSTRPCLGIAPASGGMGTHLFSDIERMLSERTSVLNDHPDYFAPEDGLALLWLEPWDGVASLDLRGLDPYFIEICRRVRLRTQDGEILAQTAPSKAARLAAKDAHGNLGDFWTPIRREDATALSLSSVGFRYDRLAKLMFDKAAFDPPAAMKVSAVQSERWTVVARGIAGGQGKTGGYHERSDIAFKANTVAAFGRTEGLDTLARTSKAQIEEIKEVESALKFGIAVAASGGKPMAELTKADRMHAGPYVRRLDEAIDGIFFACLERRFAASDDEERMVAARGEFARYMIEAARELLREAMDAVPCPVVWRYRAQARAAGAFESRLRRPKSVFSDQPEIFKSEEAHNATR